MRTKIIDGSLIVTCWIGILYVVYLLFVGEAEATGNNNQWQTCHKNLVPGFCIDNNYQNHCPVGWLPGPCGGVTPTPTPSPTPTKTPTPTPTVTVTPTLTPSPSPTVSTSPTPSNGPTPTPSEDVTPSPTPTESEEVREEARSADPWDCSKDHSCKSEPSAPQCNNAKPVGGVDNPHVYRNGGDAVVKWNPDKSKANQVHIWYYQNENIGNIHALRDRDNDGYEDDLHLLGSLNWTFGVQSANGCAAGEIKWVVDGDTDQWVLFRPI